MEAKEGIFRFGDFEFSPTERILRQNGAEIHLSRRAFDALTLLVGSHGKIVTKEELIRQIWPDSFVEDNNLSQAISALRKSLGTQANGKSFIETVPKLGYRFAAPVETAPAPNAKIDVPTTRRRGWSRAKILTVSAVLLAIVVVTVGLTRYLSRTSQGASISNVNNSSGEPRRLTQTHQNEQVAGWTSDGQVLITRWSDPDTPETYRISPDGGEAEKATSLPDVRQIVASPDGTKMVFWKYSDKGAATYMSRSDGSNAEKLPFAAENVNWSPDGAKFAFQADALDRRKLGSVEILIYDLKTKRATELTSNTNFDGDPGWSPDGRAIVFSSDRDGNYEIYSMASDGSNVRRLTNEPGHDSFPKFSPDGTLISFNSNFESETTDIYLMRTDGSGVVRLTTSKGNDLSRNGWSPDGTRFAYNSDIDGNDDIYVMTIDSFRPTLLIENANAELQTPAFSPDGQKIVYSAEFPDHHSELCVFDRISGESKTILKTTSAKNYPRWSPDGAWIAFHQEVNGRWDIFKIRPDGSDLTNLTNDPSSDSVPVWSPDSAAIYFRSNRNADTENAELFRMNADGTDQRALPIQKGKLGWPSAALEGGKIVFSADRGNDTVDEFDIYEADPATGEERCLISRAKNEIQPAISADASRIAFVGESDGNPEIYIAGSDGSNPLRLTRNAAHDLFPIFSTDGKRLIFTSDRSGRTAIYEIATDGLVR